MRSGFDHAGRTGDAKRRAGRSIPIRIQRFDEQRFLPVPDLLSLSEVACPTEELELVADDAMMVSSRIPA